MKIGIFWLDTIPLMQSRLAFDEARLKAVRLADAKRPHRIRRCVRRSSRMFAGQLPGVVRRRPVNFRSTAVQHHGQRKAQFRLRPVRSRFKLSVMQPKPKPESLDDLLANAEHFLSTRSLKMLDKSVVNMKKGLASAPIDLAAFIEA
ncbi:MAG TPA: hypothetical protein VHG71_04710 [Verrucomicrobiae bacterium]|nr:hypothetical protein [Verrucomicrobiae bacterium]